MALPKGVALRVLGLAWGQRSSRTHTYQGTCPTVPRFSIACKAGSSLRARAFGRIGLAWMVYLRAFALHRFKFAEVKGAQDELT